MAKPFLSFAHVHRMKADTQEHLPGRCVRGRPVLSRRKTSNAGYRTRRGASLDAPEGCWGSQGLSNRIWEGRLLESLFVPWGICQF